MSESAATSATWPSAPRLTSGELGNAISNLAFEKAPIGIGIVAQDGSWLRVNQELARLVGYPISELLEMSFQDLTHPDDLAADLEGLRRIAREGLSSWRTEKRYIRKDGTTLWAQIDVAVVLEPDVPIHYVTQVQDVGFRREAEARLASLALHDSLTGLPNRTLFRDRLEQALIRARRSGRMIGVAFMDLDDFKLVNDTRGHGIGDELLVRVAGRMDQLLRNSDTLARFGGDEFVALLDDINDVKLAFTLSSRLLGAMTLPYTIHGEQFAISASLGLVMADADADVDDLLRHADLAMYDSKRRGKGMVTLFEPELEHSALDRVDTERRLRQAVNDGDLFPSYQPVVELSGAGLAGYEVLARWKQSPGHVRPAADFIPIAEAAGLIPAVTEQLIAAVVADLDQLALQSEALLLLNITPDVLSAPDIPHQIAELGAMAQPGKLVLEMTETNLIRLDGSAAKSLAQLRELGIWFAVDDFGVGYSALSLIADMHPDVIKIDQSFTARLDSEFSRVLIASMVQMAEALSVLTIVEGVESIEQSRQLIELGCKYGQGYHLGHPLPIDELLGG